MVKNPPTSSGGTGSIFGPGRSHATGQLSLFTTTREQPLVATTTESLYAATKTQSSQKGKEKKTNKPGMHKPIAGTDC